MVALYAGGGPARIFSPAGTAGAVQGFRAPSGSIYGARLSTALAGNIVFRALDGGAALLIQTGQTVITAAAASMAYAGVNITLNAKRFAQVTSGTLTYTPNSVPLLQQFRATVTSATETYVPVLVEAYNVVVSQYVGFLSRVSNNLGIRF